MTKQTLAGLMAGHSNGFNSIRLIAAVVVIFSHSFVMVGLEEPLEALTGQATFGMLAVAAFFVISGLLISASFERGSVGRFVFKRAQRILPCLVVAVVLCAFVLGPIVTTLSVSDYVASPGAWAFLAHAAFIPSSYGLPGVFEGQATDAVNGSLWSLKFEVACYMLAALALMLRYFRNAIIVVAWLASFAVARAIPDDQGGVLYYINLMAELFRFFGAGMIFYVFRDRLVVRADWGWAAFVAFLASAFTPLFAEAAATFGAYALIVFAYHCSPRFMNATAKGDISYGVYVYAYPIQQLVAPVCMGLPLAWLANTLLTLPLVAVAGIASWILVEEPALRLKPRRGARTAPAIPA